MLGATPSLKYWLERTKRKRCKLFCIGSSGDTQASMNRDVTLILSKIEAGDTHAAEKLLPLIYDELRKLAADRLAKESSGQSLQPTALVHEAYVRLVDNENVQTWESRAHFFAAAAEAMRRILIERARRRASQKRGGDWKRTKLDDVICDLDNSEQILAVNEALELLELETPDLARLVKLRYFAGMTLPEAAKAMGIVRSTASRYWKFAKAQLYVHLEDLIDASDS